MLDHNYIKLYDIKNEKTKFKLNLFNYMLEI